MNTPIQSRSLNILLGFDGSQHSLAAIELLHNLDLSEDSKITIVGVLIPRESSNHAVLESALEQASHMLKEAGVQTRTELLLGNPAEKIIEIAEEIYPDLIVVGAKGLRHTLGILLGGVAQQIVEYSQQPVLVVRAPYHRIKRLLLVTDGSVSSAKAVDYLAGAQTSDQSHACKRFPLPTGAEVRVMHVLPPLPSPELIARSWPIGPDMVPIAPVDREIEAEWIKEEENRGRALLEQTISYLKRCSGVKAIPVLARGDAATEIIQYVKDHEIDLLLAGSRGLSDFRSWLLGSVSRKLVHYSSCSVLIVKGMT